MPWKPRSILPYAAKYAPPPEGGFRKVPFETRLFRNAPLELETRSIWQIAPLTDEIRQLAATFKRFDAWDVRHPGQVDPFALILHPRHSRDQAVLACRDPHVSYTPYDLNLGVTHDKVWTAGGTNSTNALSCLIHILEGKDPFGRDLPESEISRQDNEAFAGLTCH
ncbi:hypothetical protein [Methylorubrum extorquens]|uniref:Uncharacterized protein n=1 Tax=Methylorubrum extorquens (strain CM4 / NCIMB 13688) TaxID=440085 RepID=B7L2W7_METC4|nr:hypothetical protein [Methylorubrum extorquens]ACK86175.1 hypothetical protein Mchl_5418 [Methylorubrum extorquens CM4]